MKKQRDDLDYAKDLLIERAKEIYDLQHALKKYTKQMEVIDRENRDIQTDLTFKNEEFTATMDEIIFKKQH